MQDAAILVGDAGGTNVRFALAHDQGGRITLSDIWKRPSADFKTFDAAVSAFLSEAKPKLAGASFGLAGAVSKGWVELLHRNWTVDRAEMQATLGIARVVMVNDFVAMARSAPDLGGADMREVAPGRTDSEGSIAVGGPGTGFGIAILRRFAHGWVVVGGEGGHQAFGPQTEIEWKLAEKLRQTVGYVSNEFVAAGAGFDQTLEALFEVMGVAPRKLSQPDVIDQAKADDRVCLEFCRLRAATIMTAMGNLALVSNATGGVFIAGGVSVHLEPWLREKAALDRFRQRGPRTGLVAPIPIQLIVSEKAPLIGSARLWLDEQARGWL